jgi:hypothetical protein
MTPAQRQTLHQYMHAKAQQEERRKRFDRLHALVCNTLITAGLVIMAICSVIQVVREPAPIVVTMPVPDAEKQAELLKQRMDELLGGAR